jgi:hypothetical protein
MSWHKLLQIAFGCSRFYEFSQDFVFSICLSLVNALDRGAKAGLQSRIPSIQAASLEPLDTLIRGVIYDAMRCGAMYSHTFNMRLLCVVYASAVIKLK